MKEISYANIINGYKDHITDHNLQTKIEKQLQEENIESCQTCNPIKGQLSIAFSTFFTVANQHLSAQNYTARIVVLLKQILAAIKEEGCLSGGITKIINELLTTLVYRTPLGISKWGAAIFIETLIQKTNGFERASTLSEIAELIFIYTILSEGKDLKKL